MIVLSFDFIRTSMLVDLVFRTNVLRNQPFVSFLSNNVLNLKLFPSKVAFIHTKFGYVKLARQQGSLGATYLVNL